jgi:GT2 family glycosyltransferase
MKLSIIVINQNLCKLLKQSLAFLVSAAENIETEFIIVDDASTDNSVQMLKSEFPDMQLIVNNKSEGFTRSANLAAESATGDYILMVKPNIISSKETLVKALSFMDTHNDAAGLSVRMLDAEGNFVAESKSGMPLPWVRFFKFTGLSRLFTKSRLFNSFYHAAWGEEFETTELEVLNSSFMLLRRTALNKIGLFDDRFPVYGQNIDLSYRIRLAGYKNYYFAKTFVIQHDLAQEKKFSWLFTRNFYGAMFMFAFKYMFRLPEFRLKGIPGWASPSYELKK